MAYLFYASLWAVGILVPVGIYYYKQWKLERIRKGQRGFRKQFRDALETLASALSIGYSMENAIKEVQSEMQIMYTDEAPITKEFVLMVRRLNLNMTTEQVWDTFSQKIQLEETESFVTVLSLAKRSGGDSIAIIRNAVRQLGDKMEVEREIETILAAKKLEFKVMCVIPLGIIGYMRISFPEFMDVLYGNPAGVLFMSGCMLCYLAAIHLGQKIIVIEV